MTNDDFQMAVGLACEVWELPPAPEGGVSARDQRASDAWLARRMRGLSSSTERAFLQLVLDFDDRIKIGAGLADLRRSWRRKPVHRVMG